ncbi:MAG: hypothetical protein H0X30_35570 [Anaerolineae bacterium]|nr:hypothetical protein [Anaerolineae bacterium]
MIQNPSDKADALEQAMTWFGAGIEKGLALLQEDLESHDSYDPINKPYSEKNVYFDRTNQYGGWLLTSGIHWAADIYYRRMLDKILEYEKSTSKYFNKGIAYANLGITQIAQGKFDAGIAHLLTAELEDRDVANPKEFILDSILWKQFENTVFMYFISYGNKNGINFAVDNLFLEKLFKDIDGEDRIYLQGTILALLDNIELNRLAPNNFTYGRLYSMLKDLCLLIESLLHKKQTSLGNYQETLYPLLQIALKTQNINWHSSSPAPKATDFKQLVDQLENILNNQSNDQIRWADCVYLVRNFTGHHFKVDETIKSTSGKSFFGDLYLPALENTFSLLLYLKYINAI